MARLVVRLASVLALLLANSEVDAFHLLPNALSGGAGVAFRCPSRHCFARPKGLVQGLRVCWPTWSPSPPCMCGESSAAPCATSAVRVGPATDRMFGSLASLRLGELTRNFEDMSLRDAELLEMNKASQGTTCLAATVPSTHSLAKELPPLDVPGVSNVREMLALGWITHEAADERIRQLEQEWADQLSAGTQSKVIGAVDIQGLEDSPFPFLPLNLGASRHGDDAEGRLYYVCNMVVFEGARGFGVGKKLLAAALSHAKDAGATSVCLQVRHHNEAAQRLYRRAGFAPPGDAEVTSSILRRIKAKVETTDASECDLLTLEFDGGPGE